MKKDIPLIGGEAALSIAEAARRIGVSTAALSYALRGNGRLSDETRARLLRQMREIGYTPNAHAQRLRTGRSNLVALDDRRDGLGNDLWAMQLARRLQFALQKRGYVMALNTAAGDVEAENQLREWARSRAIGGSLLVGQLSFAAAFLAEISGPNAPCVVIDGDITGTAEELSQLTHVASVRVDYGGIGDAARYLYALGHRRVGFFDYYFDGPAPSQQQPLERLAAELSALGISLRREDTLALRGGADEGAAALRALFSQPSRPTALFACDDAMGLLILRVAADCGLRVPQDISLVGLFNMPFAGILTPPLTAVLLDADAVSETAADALMRLSSGLDGGIGRESLCVETSLCVRDSAAPPPLP